jgi:MarR-like DNA-binding transcriptional regulator SgrR of sgrS sRNA
MPPHYGWRARLAGGLALALVAGACPEQRPPPPPTAERPSPRGTIRLAYPEVPPSLNPVTDGSPETSDILRAILPSFHLVEPDLDYRPWLLEGEPEVRSDRETMRIRFRIRDGATWSDGDPIGVDDVAFTWRVMTDPDLEVARPEGFEHIRDVRQESERVGTLVLSPPLRSWRELFSAGRFVLPSHLADGPGSVRGWDRGPPVGAGPFTLERSVPGRSVILRANPRFFGPAPLAERIEVAFVPDPTTAVQLLREGLVDAVAPMPGVSWSRRLAALPGVQTSSAFGPDILNLVIEAGRIPVLEERRRIADSVDRARFQEAVVREEGRLADSVVAPGQTGSLPTWDVYGRGGPSGRAPPAAVAGRELSLAYVRSELLDVAGRFVQGELRAAGFDVELVPLESDVFHGIFVPARRYDLALWESRTGPAPDLSAWFVDPDAGPALSAERDVRLRALEENWDRRGDMDALAGAQRRLARLATVLPLFQPKVTMAWGEGIKGPEANPTVEGPLWNAWAWSEA